MYACTCNYVHVPSSYPIKSCTCSSNYDFADVSSLERCPLFRGWNVWSLLTWGLEDVSSLERCPLFRGWNVWSLLTWNLAYRCVLIRKWSSLSYTCTSFLSSQEETTSPASSTWATGSTRQATLSTFCLGIWATSTFGATGPSQYVAQFDDYIHVCILHMGILNTKLYLGSNQ